MKLFLEYSKDKHIVHQDLHQVLQQQPSNTLEEVENLVH